MLPSKCQNDMIVDVKQIFPYQNSIKWFHDGGTRTAGTCRVQETKKKLNNTRVSVSNHASSASIVMVSESVFAQYIFSIL